MRRGEGAFMIEGVGGYVCGGLLCWLDEAVFYREG